MNYEELVRRTEAARERMLPRLLELVPNEEEVELILDVTKYAMVQAVQGVARGKEMELTVVANYPDVVPAIELVIETFFEAVSEIYDVRIMSNERQVSFSLRRR